MPTPDVDHDGTAAPNWVAACRTEDVEQEDVIGFTHNDKRYAVYRSIDDRFFATDGACTHENVDLSDGFVMDCVIECPRHNGRFDYTTGAALGAPVVDPLTTYAVRVSEGQVYVAIP